MIKIDIDKRCFNEVYLPYLDDQTRNQIFYGGSSSGKSRFLAQRLVYDLLGGIRNYLVVRNTANTHRITTFPEIKNVISDWDLERLFVIRKSDLTITCSGANNRQAIFVGLDDVEKIKGAKPDNDGIITDIWVEEATETNYDDNQNLKKRLRGLSKVKKRISRSFNPIMRSHWICKEYFQDFSDSDTLLRDGNLSILKTTYKDNRFLASDDIEDLEDETDEYYYNVYTLGNWGVLGHVIFTNWHTEDLTGLRDSFAAYNNGLDWGFTNDPSALARCAIKEGKLYITQGFYEYGLTNPMIADLVRPIIGREPLRCGSDEPKSTHELRSLGINAMSARTGKGSVNHGIQFIKQHEVIIDRQMQYAVNEFQLYQYQVNKDGEILNVPIDKNNHFIDGLRYGVSGISFPKPEEESTIDRRALGFPG